ncbi:MAG: hypothetical protein RSB41_04230 [Bacilli bacterium]
MNFFLDNLIMFLISYLFIFLMYILFINRKGKKRDKKIYPEVEYLKNKFKLNSKVKDKDLLMITSLINSFIVSFTFIIVINFDKLIWGILVGFVILMILIYSLYEIAGRILKKRCK